MFNKIRILLIIAVYTVGFFTWAAGTGKDTKVAPVKPIVLKAAAMLDVKSGKIVEDVRIVVKGDKIVSVNPGTLPKDAEVLDLGDVFLLPGLIDSHTHIGWQLGKSSFMEQVTRSTADYALNATVYTKRTLFAGFTTVRECGSGEFLDVSLKKAIDTGKIIGPRIIPAGHAVGITGGHGDASGFKPGLLEEDWRAGVADGPEEVLKAVRYQIKHGAEVIKIMATAGVLSFEKNVGAQQMTFEEMRTAVEEAARHGLKVSAHAHGTDGIITAVKAGVASVEHGSILNDEAIRLMKEKGTYLVPTSAVTKHLPLDVLPPLLKEKALKIMPIMRLSFKKALAAGVKIAFGTDAGVFPHGLNAVEFAIMVEMGMTPLHAVQTATINAADLLGVTDRGTLEAGKLADIIAVKGNPLKNVKILERVGFVMKGGKVYTNLLK
jgi:imidazolonepropionase-like amidohydrolase